MTSNEDNEAQCNNQLNIASRTRSHLRYSDFTPNDNLDLPDIDPNLYKNGDVEVDTEYKKFCSQLYSGDIAEVDTNTDDNDPEYVYNDDIFCHGWRLDLNEVTELLQDEAESNCQSVGYDQPQASSSVGDYGQQDINIISMQWPTSKSPTKLHRRRIDMFNEPEFARVLNQQLRQHIQLLTQTYLLTKNTTGMRDEAEEARGHLESYTKIFKNKSKPSNLLPALDLVNNLAIPKDLRSSIRSNWRPIPVPDSVRKVISKNPQVFMYRRLLPMVAFSKLTRNPNLPKKPKINFTANEDKLLAYALHEFKGESSSYAYIASLLMTAKTKTQISNHIKNIKRSSGNEDNPIKLYYSQGQLPYIDLSDDVDLVSPSDEVISEEDDNSRTEISMANNEEERQMDLGSNLDGVNGQNFNHEEGLEVTPVDEVHSNDFTSALFQSMTSHQGSDDLMNMDLDDLMAASTTISKAITSVPSGNVTTNNLESKSVKYMRLKKSMLNLMSHNFRLPPDMSDLIIFSFLKTAQTRLTERNYYHLLQLLSDLMRLESKTGSDDKVINIYLEISNFLKRVDAPETLREQIILFLNFNQALKCGCSLSYLHWMRIFRFMQDLEIYHEGVESLEKKLVRLIDALQKDDHHKIRLAVGNLISKHPYLKREFDSLFLDGKPHSSMFTCEEDFDDITELLSNIDKYGEVNDNCDIYQFEHFNSKLTKEELTYATQSCVCGCHAKTLSDNQQIQHCTRCNLKFMKGRLYLVNKIKPILAEWSWKTESTHKTEIEVLANNPWTFEEDKELLEFCRAKAEQNEETISFDTSTFEELVERHQHNEGTKFKKTAIEIAERFNQLMELYNENL